jgi:predicted phosphodiesterase
LLSEAGVTTVRGNHDRWLLEGTFLTPDAHRPEDLTPETLAYLRALPTSLEFAVRDGETALVCHGLGDNDMNTITADDYGYALEVNDELQQLLRAGRPRLILKGHRHRRAIWRIGDITLVDAGTLLDGAAACGVIVDAEAHAITPLSLNGDRIEERAPHPITPGR